MGELIAKYLQGGGWRVETDRNKKIIAGLIVHPDLIQRGFYIGMNHEEKVLQRWYDHGRLETYLLYRTQSKELGQRMERLLIEEFNDHPNNRNRRKGGGGVGEANWYNVYVHFKED